MVSKNSPEMICKRNLETTRLVREHDLLCVTPDSEIIRHYSVLQYVMRLYIYIYITVRFCTLKYTFHWCGNIVYEFSCIISYTGNT